MLQLPERRERVVHQSKGTLLKSRAFPSRSHIYYMTVSKAPKRGRVSDPAAGAHWGQDPGQREMYRGAVGATC